MSSHNLTKSSQLQQRALRSIPLGVNSNGRFWGEGKTLYFKRAKGAYVWDLDDNQYVDYRLAFGPVILGYAYDEVDDRVIEAIRKGVTPGITSEVEVKVAEKIIDMCPGVEMVRLVNTGTEAVMHTLRVARAYTGREKVIKFEGGYHGGLDYLLFSTYAPPKTYGNINNPVIIPASSGIPRSLADLVIAIPFNNREVLEKVLQRVGHDVAAIMAEPMLGNFGSAEPEPGYLQFLKDKCDEYGILLVFDEVKTGFRIAQGGAHEYYGVRPHLTAYAKSLGNGYPIAAYGGEKDIMSIVGKGVTQGGTYAGNAVATSAADATLDILKEQPVIETTRNLGTRLQEGLREIFAEADIPVLISPHPAIFTLSFGVNQVRDARDWGKSNTRYYHKLLTGLLSRGILIDEDAREPWCLSYSHTKEDIDHTLSVVNEVVRETPYIE
jgi:glutamate-1-semialdehyde 2,1-aminomutase